MKLSEKAEKALQQPDTRVIATEMTPEIKAKFSRVCGQIVDLLRANCSSPVEAYMILHFVVNSFEENYGIRGAVAVGDERED